MLTETLPETGNPKPDIGRGLVFAVFFLVSVFWSPSFAHACEKPDINASVMLHRDNMPEICGGMRWVPVTGYPYGAHGVTFDGVHDYLTRGGKLTGAADSPKVTGSFWIRRPPRFGGTNLLDSRLRAGMTGQPRKTAEEIYSATAAADTRFEISLTEAGKLRFAGRDRGNTVRLDVTGGTAITDPYWHHVLFSFDLTKAAHRYIYLDDAPETLTVAAYSQGSIGFSAATETAIGARDVTGAKSVGSKLAGGLFAGGLADFWLDAGTCLDLSLAANREKFISAIGIPIFLSPKGAAPTGSAPEVYLSDANGAIWSANRGTGGGFTGHGNLAQAQ